MNLSPEVFSLLAALVEDAAGLHYAERDRELFAERVRVRTAERGVDSYLEYYYLLRYDDPRHEELDALVDVLVVSETYFFRELASIEALVDHLLLPALAGAPGRRARVWCAACATGEEPLTLAMVLDSRGVLGQVEIVASDISPRGLERAKRGVYRGRSLRTERPAFAAAYMRDRSDGSVEIEARLRTAVDWRRVNLLDAGAIASLGSFDAILCRNVLIYFRDATVEAVARALVDALRPGGVLVVGASESLLRFSLALSCEEHGGAFFYVRRVAS